MIYWLIDEEELLMSSDLMQCSLWTDNVEHFFHNIQINHRFAERLNELNVIYYSI